MFSALSLTSLFDGFNPNEIDNFLARTMYESRQIAPGDVIALKGGPCHSLILLVEGSVRCETPVSTGDPVPVERLHAPGVIAPGLLYAPDNRFPVHWVAETPSVVTSVPKNDWTTLLQQNKRLLENFLSLVSDAAKPLSDKVAYRAFKTIKGKFSRYLLDLAEQSGSDALRLALTQRELAELFGVTRPALARAIGEMAAEGAIYTNRKEVNILFPEKLKQYIG